jgi:hypothetical protein
LTAQHIDFEIYFTAPRVTQAHHGGLEVFGVAGSARDRLKKMKYRKGTRHPAISSKPKQAALLSRRHGLEACD